jgi:hypothetical protein
MDTLAQVALLAGLALAVNKTVTVLKALGKNWNTVVTQALVWVLGIAAILLAAHAKVTMDAAVPGTPWLFGQLDGSSIVLLGWVLGSSGSFAFDLRKAIDNSDSAAEPPLLPKQAAAA